MFDGKIKELTSKEIRYAFKDADTIDIEEDILLIDVLVNSKQLPVKEKQESLLIMGQSQLMEKDVLH